MTAQKNKTCCHCQAELPELVDSNESLSQYSGLCASCRAFKAAWHAEFQRRGNGGHEPKKKEAHQ